MDAARERLSFLLDTVALEADHLLGTDSRLFAEPFTPVAGDSKEALSTT